MPYTPLRLISTDNLFRLAALYYADINDAKRSGDEEAEKRLSAKEAEIYAEKLRKLSIDNTSEGCDSRRHLHETN